MKPVAPVRILAVLLAVLAAAAAKDREFRIDGRIVPAAPLGVTIHGSTAPYQDNTVSGPDGRFRFSHLPAGSYTLIVFVPGAGEFRRTVPVGPGSATRKGVVKVQLDADTLTPVEPDNGARFTVSVGELKIPDKALNEYRKAQSRLSKRDVPGAREHLQAAVKLAPKFVEAWNTLGTISYQTGAFAEAEKYFRQALECDPSSYAPLVNLGGTLLSLQRYADALPYNRRAVDVRPNDPLADSQLGMNYSGLGRWNEAATYLEKAIRLDPAHFSCPQLSLAGVYVQLNKPAEAAATLEDFLRWHPDWANAAGVREAIGKLRQPAPNR